MGPHKLTRWQKASAIVPMAVLVGAWGAALTNTGLATASNNINDSAIPDVPANAFSQPASVQSTPTPTGIDSKAGTVNAVSSLSTNGIPSAALAAYRRAEMLLNKADPSCNISWTLIAAIGRVESNHGRTGGNSVNSDGVSTPGIYGVALDGSGNNASIRDTDSGKYDNDGVWDRAVGPMQFIPGTWTAVGVDADGDKKKNPQDIDDAATSAGVYLCAGSDDLSKDSGARASVHRYNQSDDYVDLVMQIAGQYAKGDFTPSANGLSASPVLTNRANDQTLSPSERSQAKKQQAKARKVAAKKRNKKSGSSTSTAPQSGSTAGSGSGSGSTSPVPSSGDTAPKTGIKETTKKVTKPVTEIVPKPVTKVLTRVQAEAACNLKYPVRLTSAKIQAYNDCVYDLTH